MCCWQRRPAFGVHEEKEGPGNAKEAGGTRGEKGEEVHSVPFLLLNGVHVTRGALFFP